MLQTRARVEAERAGEEQQWRRKWRKLQGLMQQHRQEADRSTKLADAAHQELDEARQAHRQQVHTLSLRVTELELALEAAQQREKQHVAKLEAQAAAAAELREELKSQRELHSKQQLQYRMVRACSSLVSPADPHSGATAAARGGCCRSRPPQQTGTAAAVCSGAAERPKKEGAWR